MMTPTQNTVPTAIQIVQARDIVAAARTRAVRRLPYFSSPTLALRPFALPGLGTFGVDDRSRMAFDPLAALAWGVLYSTTVILHEALHILLNHHGRQNGREPYRWNLATDCECNRILGEAGLEFPPGTKPVTSKSLGFPPNLTAEEYYDLIMPETAQSWKSLIIVVGGIAIPGCGTPCGTGGGAAQGWEEKADELSGGLEGQNPADQRSMRRATAEAIQAAVATGAYGIGTVPAGLRVWATLQLQPPVVPWTRILPALVRSALASRSGADDYTRSRVSRRSTAYLGKLPILPAIRSPKPEVTVVVDLSGSMIGAPARRAISETIGVVKALGYPVRTLAVDTEIQADVVVATSRDAEKLNRGAGGTDMVVGIRAADRPKRGARPDVIVLVTDGCTPWPMPAEMPRAKLVVAVIGNVEIPPHITRVVRIPQEDRQHAA